MVNNLNGVKMKYRKLGKHGIKVSEISLGTMFYGSYLKTEQAVKCLNEAVNQGINYIDSANRYGMHDSDLPMDQRMRAELVIKEFLKEHDRDDLVISTKVHYKMRESVNSGGLSRKTIRENIRRSLEALGTDYVDLYFCHRQDPDTPLEETIRVMTDLVDEGLIHYWGTSWVPPWRLQQLIGIAKEIGCVPPSMEQPPYHLGARYIEADLIPQASAVGFGITCFEALNSGIFTGKYVDDNGELVRVPGSRMETPDADFEFAEIIKTRYADKIVKLRQLCKELDIGLNHLALAWTLRHPEISSSITGATKPEQVADNAKASEVGLSEDTLSRIEEIMDNRPKEFYR